MVPPHLPSARTGSKRAFQSTPAMPKPLFAAAPIRPATCVPCQVLSVALGHSTKGGLPASLALIQSPGSLGAELRPSPSLAVGKGPNTEKWAVLESVVFLGITKLYPLARRPLRSGLAGSPPVSITATTTDE